MKRLRYYMQIVAVALLTMAAVSSCGDSPDPDPDPDPTPSGDAQRSFESQTIVGFYKAGKSQFTFSEIAHQIYINGQYTKFYLTTDDRSSALKCDFSTTPDNGTTLTATVDNNGTTTNLTLTEVKSSSDLLWLWDDNSGMGLIIPDYAK